MNKIKICVISHSNVHLRQILFFKELSKHGEILVISPQKWGSLKCNSVKDGNFEIFTDVVTNEGNMKSYCISDKSIQRIFEFKPDLIYHQGETYFFMANICRELAKRINCKLVNFCWENIRKPPREEVSFLKECDLVIAGNSESQKLNNADIVMPQVGIGTGLFCNKNIKKEYDVVYVGREDVAKGTNYIKEAFPKTKFISGIDYDDVPLEMNKSKLFVTYPYDTLYWIEQFNYSIAEALACEVPVICSNSGAIPQWYGNSGAVIIEQKNPNLLKEKISEMLSDYDKLSDLKKKGRKFVEQNYSNKILAKKLFNIFKTLFMGDNLQQ